MVKKGTGIREKTRERWTEREVESRFRGETERERALN